MARTRQVSEYEATLALVRRPRKPGARLKAAAKKSNNPAGRYLGTNPLGGDTAAVVVPVRMPVALRDSMDAAAHVAGVTRSDWLRLAVEAALGAEGRS